jgi:putative spermidine/putrescine transport system ATP-binding protein
LTLLGPSGCGKTTLLRLLAGFEPPDAGAVLISGRDVAGLPPYRRPVNTVFQHYALFPHRTVAGNVAFGLEAKGLAKAAIPLRVEKALEMVRLSGLGERRIDQLSGGQKQRVAFARAVVLEPEVLLLDEPLAALDLKLRKEMQVELKNLQERLGITFVFVTHDQQEALSMSDRVAVFNAGRIEQVGAPADVYDRPGSAFVAGFVGISNVLTGDTAKSVLGEEGSFAIRPEKISIGGEPAAGEVAVAGRVVEVVYGGPTTRLIVDVDGGARLVALHQNATGGAPHGDTPVTLRWRREHAVRLPA